MSDTNEENKPNDQPSRGSGSDAEAQRVADQIDAVRKARGLPPVTGRPDAGR